MYTKIGNINFVTSMIYKYGYYQRTFPVLQRERPYIFYVILRPQTNSDCKDFVINENKYYINDDKYKRYDINLLTNERDIIEPELFYCSKEECIKYCNSIERDISDLNKIINKKV